MRILFILLLSSYCSLAQTTYTTLRNVVAQSSTNFVLSSNQLVRIISIAARGQPASGYNAGTTELRASYPGLPGPWPLAPGAHVLGPAVITFQSFFPPAWRGGEEPAAICIIEVQIVNPAPESPQRVVIQPSGHPARLTVQWSADLKTWQTLRVFDVEKSSLNYFYRLGIDLN